VSVGIERALSVFDGKEMCPGCDGQGWTAEEEMVDGEYNWWKRGCGQCHGEGWVVREPCIACGAPITLDYEHSNEEHDAGCPVIDHPGSLAVEAQALADKAAAEAAWPTCHLPRWINADGKCEHTDHEEVQR
jgi:hypothetical protein